MAALLAGLAGRAAIETPSSAVFVGADTVWKLRKAVRLEFLDFTSVAERRRTAERELALNAAAAPGLYRDVVAVARAADGTLRLGGAGEVVDWVVRMAPVPAGDFLDRRLGDLSPVLLDGLADAVAAMHADLAVARDVPGDVRGRLDAIADGNRRSAVAAGLAPGRVAGWHAAMTEALAGLAPWLRRREEGGFVRRTHGDLHLGNIVLWGGRPVPIDALEFDEAMATSDVAYDLAFLLMDLDVRVGRGAANRVLNRYLARGYDMAAVEGLPALMSMRAMVRAHVAARSLEAAGAERYLGAAEAYLRPRAAVTVAIGGLQGTGKSSLARALAPELGRAPGAVILRSDEIRKFLNGVAPEERLPKSAYDPAVGRAVFAALADHVAAGGGQAVIADAMFFDARHRAAVRQAAPGAFHGFWLTADLAELEARVAARRGDASDADVEVLRRAAAADPGPGDWHLIRAGAADDPVAQVWRVLAAAGAL